jgi:cell division protein FtsI/penicillin-binding protein 2
MKPGSVKLLVLFGGFLVLMGIIAIRLVDIQIADHEYYENIAARMHGFLRPIPAKRGTLYDRNLRPLTMTLPAYRVCADPSLIEDPTGRSMSRRCAILRASISQVFSLRSREGV